jgi:hypothetical protein
MSESDIKQSDLAVRPTIIIIIDEYGDVNFASNDESIDLPTAIAMCQLAQQKMMAAYFNSVRESKRRTESMRPQILLPT